MQAATNSNPVEASLQNRPWANMLNVLACPAEVFEAVAATPPNLANWRLPTLLVAFTAIISVQCGPLQHHAEPPTLPDPLGTQHLIAGYWPMLSSLTVLLSAFAGSLWSAFALWFIGRVFLRTRFSWLKAVEVVGLSGTVAVLGIVVTGLLITIFQDPTAHAALSLLLAKSSHGSRLHQVLGVFDLFTLWNAILLALGLSKLTGARFSEASFWVFGYWFALRLALTLLA